MLLTYVRKKPTRHFGHVQQPRNRFPKELSPLSMFIDLHWASFIAHSGDSYVTAQPDMAGDSIASGWGKRNLDLDCDPRIHWLIYVFLIEMGLSVVNMFILGFDTICKCNLKLNIDKYVVYFDILHMFQINYFH